MVLTCQTCGKPGGVYTHCIFCMTKAQNKCKCGKYKDKTDEKCYTCKLVPNFKLYHVHIS